MDWGRPLKAYGFISVCLFSLYRGRGSDKGDRGNKRRGKGQPIVIGSRQQKILRGEKAHAVSVNSGVRSVHAVLSLATPDDCLSPFFALHDRGDPVPWHVLPGLGPWGIMGFYLCPAVFVTVFLPFYSALITHRNTSAKRKKPRDRNPWAGFLPLA